MLDAMPALGYGTWNRPGDQAYEGVATALDVGYRHLDCAEGYENEEHVGRAIAESGVKRDDLWITTKIAPENFGPGQLRPHAEASMEKLGVDQLDLLLLHYPSINDEYEIEDYMAQLAELLDSGLTRNIGVSNFTIRYIDRARELLGSRKIFTNQVEKHPYLHNNTIVDHCRSLNIPITCYSPLARGEAAEDTVLIGIAEEVGATPSQVALAWLLAQGHAVIPSAGARTRIEENFAARDIELDARQLKSVDGLDRDMRLVNGPWCPEWDR